MNQQPLFLFSILVFALLLVQCGSTDPDREANRLFVEAYRLTDEARDLENENPVEAYQKYESALARIERIIEEFSETDVAVNVTQQQTRIGEMTIGELRRIVPVFEARANALDSFERLADYMFNRVDDELQRAEKKIRYARWLRDRDQAYTSVLEDVSQLANRQWNTEISDPIYLRLSSAYALFGDWESAIQTADRIQSRRMLFEALETMIEAGYVRQDDEQMLEALLQLIEYAGPTESLQLVSGIVSDLFQLGEGETARELVADPLPLPDDDAVLEHIEALSNLSNVFATNGAFETSRLLIREIASLEEDYADFALRDLSVELARRRNIDEAFEIVNEFDRDYFRYEASSRIAVVQAENGRVSEALHLLSRVPDDVAEKADAKISIAYLLEDFGDHERSDSLLQVAQPTLETVSSVLQQAQLLIGLAEVYQHKEERSLAAQTLIEAEEKILAISGSGSRNHMITEISRMWIRLGRPDRVLDLATGFDMNHDGFQPLFQQILEAAIRENLHDLARTLSAMTDRPHFYTYYLAGLYIERNDLETAADISYDIRNNSKRAKALVDLSYTFTVNNVSAEADKTAADAIQVIRRIRSEAEREEVLCYVASRLAASGITMNQELHALISDVLGDLPL